MTSYNAPGRQRQNLSSRRRRKEGFSFGSKLEPSRAVEQHASGPGKKRTNNNKKKKKKKMLFVVLTRYKNVTRKVITAYVRN